MADINPQTLLMTVIYSKNRDLYRVPSNDKPWWLSVEVHPLPIPALPHNNVYLGGVLTDDGRGWRRVYSTSWRMIEPGDTVALPASDALVRDYHTVFNLS